MLLIRKIENLFDSINNFNFRFFKNDVAQDKTGKKSLKACFSVTEKENNSF
jgi:hypothetical protein